MDYAFAFLVPIVAIVGGITYSIFNQYFKTRRHLVESEGSPALRQALATSNEINAALLEKLSAMDTRLMAIERTLSEVG
jgi:hypothetical protein